MFPNITTQVVGWAIILGILLGIFIDIYRTPYVLVVYAETKVEEPKEVRIEVIYNWTEERIVEEIQNTFPEAPQLAVRIAKCESGLVIDIQSNHVLDYGREQSFGLMQIHAKVWDNKAKQLGYYNYKTDPIDNLKMARYIYEKSGNNFNAWTCYTKKMV